MQHIKKDITTVQRGIIAHGVNCKGVMGSGVAKAIKTKWPEVYKEFKKWEPSPELLGKMQLVPVTANVWVANCFTQESYGRNPSIRYASPEAVMEALREVFRFAAQDDKPIYMPPIGCGLGGLSWELDVEPTISELCEAFEVEVYICDI